MLFDFCAAKKRQIGIVVRLMNLLRSWFGGPAATEEIAAIQRQRAELASLGDDALRQRFRESRGTCWKSSRSSPWWLRAFWGSSMFDVQLQGALALARGSIAEMQTGEGKTLACTPAVAWYARSGEGVHVMTVNDYLARRDARWMGGDLPNSWASRWAASSRP